MSEEIVFSWYLVFTGDCPLLAPELSRDLGLLLVPGCHGMEFSPGTRVVAGEHLFDPTTILITKNRSVSWLLLTGHYPAPALELIGECHEITLINFWFPRSQDNTKSLRSFHWLCTVLPVIYTSGEVTVHCAIKTTKKASSSHLSLLGHFRAFLNWLGRLICNENRILIQV